MYLSLKPMKNEKERMTFTEYKEKIESQKVKHSGRSKEQIIADAERVAKMDRG